MGLSFKHKIYLKALFLAKSLFINLNLKQSISLIVYPL